MPRSPATGPFKVLAVDLDGTLLDATGTPHEADRRALQALAKSGKAHVTIATGRLFSGTRAAATASGIVGPVACADGSHIVHATDGSTLLHRGIIGSPADALSESLARHDLTTFLFAEDAIVFDSAGDFFVPYVKLWSDDIRRTARVHDHELWKSANGITAVVAIGSEAQVAAAKSDAKLAHADLLQVVTFPLKRAPAHSTHTWGFIARASGGTKASALHWLCDHHGVSIEQSVCVGDWLNDISMLEAAGRSFAMGQAPPEVKNAATDVLTETSVTGGGIARVVREVFGVDS